jgi:hypothetical protein
MNKWDTIQSDVADAYVHLNEEIDFDSDNEDIEFSLDVWDEM